MTTSSPFLQVQPRDIRAVIAEANKFIANAGHPGVISVTQIEDWLRDQGGLFATLYRPRLRMGIVRALRAAGYTASGRGSGCNTYYRGG